MSRFHSYINTAVKLIETYKGDQPFAGFLKLHFAANKKYGSKDRRFISSLCYNYYRIGFACKTEQPAKKLLIASFLCEKQPSDLLQFLMPEWNEKILLPLEEKLEVLKDDSFMKEVFPFIDDLSAGINEEEFVRSLLIQPDLFIRLRPLKKNDLLQKMETSKLSYQILEDDCVRLNNKEKVDDFFITEKEVVIQDYNSQKVLNFLKNNKVACDLKSNLSVWDCCAASGGKSILLNDILGDKIDLTVTDIRAKTILNLHQRFKKAEIKEYKYFVADITLADFKPCNTAFDLIVCDAPCTGSGTWSRTPEQLSFFKKSTIKDYKKLQQKIVSSVLPHLKKGGIFVYITCSVFKQENEIMTDFILASFNCELLDQQVLTGYNNKADSMFTAIFKKL